MEAWEAEKEAIEARFCDTDYFTNNPEAFQKDQQRLNEIETSLARAFTRWEELEEKQAGF
jgi:ATP-binding cassette subfamily F protein uup